MRCALILKKGIPQPRGIAYNYAVVMVQDRQAFGQPDEIRQSNMMFPVQSNRVVRGCDGYSLHLYMVGISKE